MLSSRAIALALLALLSLLFISFSHVPWVLASGIQGGTQAVVGTGTAGSPGTAVLTIQGIGSGTAVPISGTVTSTPSGTQTVAGAKTNNNAAPGATNIGSLGALANAAAPSWTEGNQVLNSVDLSGNQRVILNAETSKVIGTVNPGNTANATPWLVAPATEATTANSALTSYTAATASTNATSVKGSAGNIYGYSVSNNTATLYYLRMYNLSSAPTCSSATGFIETITIPASITGAGRERWHSVPQGFTTGIGFCITGGSGSTDNTNAAAGVFATILYK